MTERAAYYFGCWDGPGHYMHDRRGSHVWHMKNVCDSFPWEDRFCDGGLLNNDKHEDIPDGRVWWTVGGKPDLWHAFVWWDRSVDKRGACNSGLYVRGFDFGRTVEAFAYGQAVFPKIVERQIHPLVLQLVKRP